MTETHTSKEDRGARRVTAAVVAAVLMAVAALGVTGRPTMGAMTAEVANTDSFAGYPEVESCLEALTELGYRGGGAYYIAETRQGNWETWTDDLTYPVGTGDERAVNPYLTRGNLEPRSDGVHNYRNNVATAPAGDPPCPADPDYPGSLWTAGSEGAQTHIHQWTAAQNISSFTAVTWINTTYRQGSTLLTLTTAGNIALDPVGTVFAKADIGTTGRIVYAVSRGEGRRVLENDDRTIVRGATDVADGNWHQVALSFEDRGDGTGPMRVFVDGRLDAEAVTTVPMRNPRGHFRWGCDTVEWFPWSGQRRGAQCFHGRMGYIAAYPFAVTAEDLAGVFRRDTPRPETGARMYGGEIGPLLPGVPGLPGADRENGESRGEGDNGAPGEPGEPGGGVLGVPGDGGPNDELGGAAADESGVPGAPGVLNEPGEPGDGGPTGGPEDTAAPGRGAGPPAVDRNADRTAD